MRSACRRAFRNSRATSCRRSDSPPDRCGRCRARRRSGSASSSSSTRRSAVLPFTETGAPFSKPMVTSTGLSGASLRALASASRSRPARRWRDLPARRLRARCARCCDRGCRSSWSIARSARCASRAYSMASSRETMSHSRHGAITGKLRRQRLVGQLEADLVVALAGAAVRQRVAAGGERDFHLLLGQQRPRDRSARADTCARRRRPSAPASTDTRVTNSSRISATWTSEAPVLRAFSSQAGRAHRRPGRYRRTPRPLRSRNFPSATE